MKAVNEYYQSYISEFKEESELHKKFIYIVTSPLFLAFGGIATLCGAKKDAADDFSALMTVVSFIVLAIFGMSYLDTIHSDAEASRTKYAKLLETVRSYEDQDRRVLNNRLSFIMNDGVLSNQEADEFEKDIPKLLLNADIEM